MPTDSASSLDDRRTGIRRRTIEEHGIVSVRVRPGADATLIDVSACGALIETMHRLLPGTTVELQLATSDRRTAVRGRVVRCAVAGLRGAGVRYRGAVAFAAHLPWLTELKEEDDLGVQIL